MTEFMKFTPDDENEVHDVVDFSDPGRCHVTPVIQLPAEISLAITDALGGVGIGAQQPPTQTTQAGGAKKIAQNEYQG
ncbi:hypothetical protein ACFXPZ_21310, partial [Streptomyces sp. NPDC059101]